MNSPTPDLRGVQTLPELLAFRAALTPHSEAYRACDPGTGQWISLTWAQTQERVQQCSRAIAASGLPQGARIAILLPNGLDAMSIDQAVMATGCVPVPLHAIDNPGSIAYILADAEVSLLVVEEPEQWRRIRDVGMPLPHLMGVVTTNASTGLPTAAEQDVPVAPLAAWLQHAAADTPLPPPPGPVSLCIFSKNNPLPAATFRSRPLLLVQLHQKNAL